MKQDFDDEISGELPDIFFGVFPVSQRDTDDGEGQADEQLAAVQGAFIEDFRTVGIAEGGNVLQYVRLAGQVADDIHEIQGNGQSQADTDAALPQEGGDAEADAGQFHLEQEVGGVKQGDFLPRNRFADDGDGTDSHEPDGQVQDQHLNQDGS